MWMAPAGQEAGRCQSMRTPIVLYTAAAIDWALAIAKPLPISLQTATRCGAAHAEAAVITAIVIVPGIFMGFSSPAGQTEVGRGNCHAVIFLFGNPQMTPGSEEITVLLRAWRDGDQAAFDRLWSIVYSDLRRMARRYMRTQRPGNTLQTTALVNEAWLRLADVLRI